MASATATIRVTRSDKTEHELTRRQIAPTVQEALERLKTSVDHNCERVIELWTRE